MSKKNTRKSLVTAVLMFLGILTAQAQSTTVSGTITDGQNKQTLAGISVTVKGKVIGTITGTNGNFSLTTTTAPPFTLVVSSIGYKTQEVEVTASKAGLDITMEEQAVMGNEVVVSASRVEESVLQSPVSIEKMDIRAIQQAAAPSFYDALRNLKGVEVSTQSLTFSSVNTRGFAGNGNVRVVQMIDGMDNQAPGLNFAVGNIVGISELDLESVELLPGAASALYGPNAVNGLLLMTSKNPFNYQGLSAYAKTGLMSASNRTTQTTPFYDFSLRYAKAFNNKFAFKANVSYLTAQDWQANDSRDHSFTGLREGDPNGFNRTLANNPNYNGVNVYGDENSTNVNLYNSLLANGTPGDGTNGTSRFLGAIATTDLRPDLPGAQTLPAITGQTPRQLFDQMIPNTLVARTGYAERDLVNYNTTSLKLNGSLHYRINDKLEAIMQANWGTGSTVYTSSDRYYLRNFSMGQYKLELKGSNFFVRAYTTQERSGDTYAAGIVASNISEAWKPSTAWYPQYFGVFATGVPGTPTVGAFQTYAGAYGAALQAGQTTAQAIATAQNAVQGQWGTFHNNSRAVADQGRLLPGTPGFDATATTLQNTPIPAGGRFLDKTNLYHAEGMYNFKSLIAPETVELIVGGNVRQYDLNSGGTLFLKKTDGSEYNISEFGGYAQASKLIAEKLKLTGSIRYDKNQNFKGQWSPRVSAVYSATPNQNFRASYQTGFRIPTTQNQYINLNTPVSLLIGGLPALWDNYKLRENQTPTLESVVAGSPRAYSFPEFKPERIFTFEVGYKGLISNKFLVDVYYYNSTMRNYIGGILLRNGTNTTNGLRPGQIISMSANYDQDVRYQGFGAGLDYLFPKGYTLGGNLSNNTLSAGGVGMFDSKKNLNVLDEGFQVGFNTPKYRFNLSTGKRITASSNWGYNVTYRYQQAFYWQDLIMPAAARNAVNNREVLVPAFGTLDAQVSYKIAPIKSIIKIGGSNILKNEYRTGWGNPIIGSMYYVSLTFDEFLN